MIPHPNYYCYVTSGVVDSVPTYPRIFCSTDMGELRINMDVIGVTILYFASIKKINTLNASSNVWPNAMREILRGSVIRSQPNVTVRFSFEMKVRCRFALSQLFV
jgi:hypothetical protein